MAVFTAPLFYSDLFITAYIKIMCMEQLRTVNRNEVCVEKLEAEYGNVFLKCQYNALLFCYYMFFFEGGMQLI
jgi:hypothetical protein